MLIWLLVSEANARVASSGPGDTRYSGSRGANILNVAKQDISTFQNDDWPCKMTEICSATKIDQRGNLWDIYTQVARLCPKTSHWANKILNKQRRRPKHGTSFSAPFAGRFSRHLAIASLYTVARVPRAATRRFTE